MIKIRDMKINIMLKVHIANPMRTKKRLSSVSILHLGSILRSILTEYYNFMSKKFCMKISQRQSSEHLKGRS